MGSTSLQTALGASLDLAQWYAREHVVMCLLPAFLIAGAVSVYVSPTAIVHYLGAQAKKYVSYSVAAVSGVMLSVCSCTILPLFSSIYHRGAGLGPAVAFLYSGPAISVLSIILTTKILGFEMGLVRALGAVGFSVVIGLAMAAIYRKEDRKRTKVQGAFGDTEAIWRPPASRVLCARRLASTRQLLQSFACMPVACAISQGQRFPMPMWGRNVL